MQWKRSLQMLAAGAAALALLFGTVAGAAEPERSVVKDQTVYAMLAPDGRAAGATVVNHIQTPEAGIYADDGAYGEIANLTGEEIPVRAGQQVRWTLPARAAGFYYQGEVADAELPFTVSLAYELEGRRLTAEEMAGQSGHGALELRIAANPQAAAFFRSNYLAQAQIPFDLARFHNLDAGDGSEVILGSTATVALMVLPGGSKTFRIEFDVEDFALDAIQIACSYCDIAALTGLELDPAALSAGVEGMLTGVDSLQAGTGALQEGLEATAAGAQGLAQGGQALAEGAQELRQAGGALGTGATQVAKGAEELAGGAAGLYSGTQALLEGIRSYVNGADGLAASAQAIHGGAAKLAAQGNGLIQGYEQLQTGIAGLLATLPPELAAAYGEQLQALNGQLAAFGNGLGAYAGGVTELTAGLADWQQGAQDYAGQGRELIAGAGELTEGAAELTDGLQEFTLGAKELRDGLDEYRSGVAGLAQGAEDLAQGLTTYAGGTQELPGGAQALLEGQAQLREGIAAAGEQLQGLELPQNTDDPLVCFAGGTVAPQSVQFVMQIPAVSAEASEPADAEPEREPTLWERFLALFGL